MRTATTSFCPNPNYFNPHIYWKWFLVIFCHTGVIALPIGTYHIGTMGRLQQIPKTEYLGRIRETCSNNDQRCIEHLHSFGDFFHPKIHSVISFSERVICHNCRFGRILINIINTCVDILSTKILLHHFDVVMLILSREFEVVSIRVILSGVLPDKVLDLQIAFILI